jgi:superfamily I DNA and/or RNA helicase
MKKDYDQTISMISEIALPSIITLLQEGIKNRSENSKSTILNSGFSLPDKINRFERLEYQYRMHSDISRIPRNIVYEEQALKDDIRLYNDSKVFDNQNRFSIIDVKGANVNRNRNEKEMIQVMELLKYYDRFSEEKDKNIRVAVLAFYNGQVTLIRDKIKKYFNSTKLYNFKKKKFHVTINTVDRFQGQEADVVILSMVQNNRLGFMDSINRINVAITRAKEVLNIIGDKTYFTKTQKNSVILKTLFNEGDK